MAGRLVESAQRAWRHPWGPYALAFLVQLALAPWFVHDWDGFVFITATQQFLQGLTPYQVAAEAPSYIFLALEWPAPNSWYAYPPGALLLMTPFIWLAQAVAAADPYVLRAAFKVPFIFGNLLLAYAVARAVAALGGDARASRRGALFVLFNPFLIFIAAVWGMFDAWMMALLVLSAVWIFENRPVAAGLAFAGATLIKVFPLFVSPLFLLFALRAMREKQDAGRFVATSAGAFAAACLPFFLASPGGFWLQTVGMHVARPIQGFAAVGLPYLPRFTSLHFGIDLWDVPPGWVAPAVSFALMVPGVILLLAYGASREANLRGLLVATLATFSLLLLVSKVVNEQYFIMPISLLTILVCAPAPHARLHKALLHAWTWGGLSAALVIGFHFLLFMPSEVAVALIGMTPEEAIYGMGLAAQRWFGADPTKFFVLTDVAGALFVVPALVLSLLLVAPPLRDGWRHLAAEARPHVPQARRALAAVAFVGLVAGPVVTAATLPGDEGPHYDPMPPLSEKMVGAIYYVWWNNPSHLPDKADGNWERTSLAPAKGYYTSIGHQIAHDVDLMRAAGIDFAAVSYHGYDHGRYEIVSVVARAKGLYFAPIVELSVLHGNDRLRAAGSDPTYPWLKPTDDAADAAKELVERALKLGGSEAYVRVDGKPLVFVSDAHLMGPSWDPESIDVLAREVLALHDGSFANVSAAWGAPVATLADIAARHPADVAAFMDDSPVADDWRAALRLRQAWFLDHLRTASGVPIHLVATRDVEWPPQEPDARAHPELDGAFNDGFLRVQLGMPGDAAVDDVLDVWEHNQRVAFEQYGADAWATVSYAANDVPYRGPGLGMVVAPDAVAGDTHAATWRLAEELGAMRVLIASWNQYFDGTSIEPTHEYGRAPLDAIRGSIAAWKTR